MPQIANQDYFNLGNVHGTTYQTSYQILLQIERGTLLDCFFDSVGSKKGRFRVLSYVLVDNGIDIKYAGDSTNVQTMFVVNRPIEQYRVLAEIEEQIPDFTFSPDENGYLLADDAHVCAGGYGIIITESEEIITSCVKGEPITEGEIVEISENDMQYLVGAQLY